MHASRLTLTSVYLTFFVDSLAWAIVFPVFAPYFLDMDNSLFSPSMSLAWRTTILGFFLMAFSLGQFLAAPIMGEYADRFGRRRALVLTVFFAFISMVFTAWSMEMQSLIGLFAGRLLSGIFASNTSICLACIADLSSDEKSKVTKFGYFSVLGGLSFVLGAFLGGKLSDPSLSSFFSPTIPLWLAAVLSLFNFLFVLFCFKETSKIDTSVVFDYLESFHNIKNTLKEGKIRLFYIIYFLFLFGWAMLFQFTPVLVVNRYAFSNSEIGDLALFIGLCWGLGSSVLNKILNHFFKPLTVLEFCLLMFVLLCGGIFFISNMWCVLSLLSLAVIIGGLAWPICTGLISNLSSKRTQGKILGVTQSIQSLAMTVAPLIGGVAYHVMDGFPFLLAAGSSLVASIIYFALKDR